MKPSHTVFEPILKTAVLKVAFWGGENTNDSLYSGLLKENHFHDLLKVVAVSENKRESN